MDGNEENIAELAEIFDSPLKEQPIWVIAALFGKEMPPVRDMAAGSSVVMGAACVLLGVQLGWCLTGFDGLEP